MSLSHLPASVRHCCPLPAHVPLKPTTANAARAWHITSDISRALIDVLNRLLDWHGKVHLSNTGVVRLHEAGIIAVRDVENILADALHIFFFDVIIICYRAVATTVWF